MSPVLSATHLPSKQDAKGKGSLRGLAHGVQQAGSLSAWNKQASLAGLDTMLEVAGLATTVDEALEQLRAILSLGHQLWAFAYMRKLASLDMDLYMGVCLASPRATSGVSDGEAIISARWSLQSSLVSRSDIRNKRHSITGLQ